jgi:hypothetical protein
MACRSELSSGFQRTRRDVEAVCFSLLQRIVVYESMSKLEVHGLRRERDIVTMEDENVS